MAALVLMAVKTHVCMHCCTFNSVQPHLCRHGCTKCNGCLCQAVSHMSVAVGAVSLHSWSGKLWLCQLWDAGLHYLQAPCQAGEELVGAAPGAPPSPEEAAGEGSRALGQQAGE